MFRYAVIQRQCPLNFHKSNSFSVRSLERHFASFTSSILPSKIQKLKAKRCLEHIHRSRKHESKWPCTLSLIETKYIKTNSSNNNILLRYFSSFILEEKNDGESVISSLSLKDTRARKKLEILKKMKRNANDAQIALQGEFPFIHNETCKREMKDSEFYKEWKECEKSVFKAYGQAIKYTARTNEKDSALQAQALLEDMISRSEITSRTTKHHIEYQVENDAKHVLINLIERNDLSFPYEENTIDSPVLPPTRKMFHDILHSWANSKVRKKGFIAESFLVRMTELSLGHPTFFDFMPDSKAFSLAVKCHSGSTHKSKVDNIIGLHEAHAAFAERKIPMVSANDPNFLILSIKSLKNFKRKREAKLAEEWFSRLHNSILEYTGSKDDQNRLSQATTSNTLNLLDVTGAYNSVIRGLVNGKVKDATQKALKVLEKMHEIANLSGNETVAHIDIKTNTYDLILRSYRSDRTKESAEKTVNLLYSMIEHSKNAHDEYNTIPGPSEQSFQLCLQGLASHPDSEWVFKNSKSIVNKFEFLLDDRSLAPSTLIHNCLIELYAGSFPNTSHLIPRVLDVVENMNKLAERFPKLRPDSDTLSNIILTCSVAPKDVDSSQKALDLATNTFAEIKDDSTTHKVSDRCIYFMMRCTLQHIKDSEMDETKVEKIIKLFYESCELGLVSYDILQCLKSTVSSDQFKAMVGNGRLANNWVQNVTSKKVLYTDGSMGGPGKSIRRRGKISRSKNNRK